MTGTISLLRPEVFESPEVLAIHASDWLLGLALHSTQRFAVALSGGETPRRLYELMASAPYRDRFPWSRVHWFWGDERFVPHTDPRSNYRMVQDALFSRVPVFEANIHTIATEGTDLEQAALQYEDMLKSFYGAACLDPARLLFDVVLLGLGEDGHTASLFPDTAVLDERERWAAPVCGVRDEPRITLTYPVLESAANVAFLIAGAGKQSALAGLCAGDHIIPAGRLRPRGALHIFADAGAAGILKEAHHERED